MGATNVARKLPSPSRVLDTALAFVLPIAFGVALISLWEAGIIHRILGVKTLQLPLPSRILAVFCENAGKIVPDAASTLSTALGGLMVGSALGFLVAVTATFFPRWGYGGLIIHIDCSHQISATFFFPHSFTRSSGPSRITRSRRVDAAGHTRDRVIRSSPEKSEST